MFIGIWKDYLKHRVVGEVPPLNIIGLSALAAFFIGSGIWGLMR